MKTVFIKKVTYAAFFCLNFLSFSFSSVFLLYKARRDLVKGIMRYIHCKNGNNDNYYHYHTGCPKKANGAFSVLCELKVSYFIIR